MSQQVRFAPGASLDVCYWRNGSIVVQRPDGTERALGSGHHPDWLDSASVAYCPPGEGVVQVATPSGIAQLTVPAGNTLTAASGKVAVHRTDPRRVLTSWGSSAVPGATDPALSADGQWLAYLLPDWPNNGLCSLAVARSAHPQSAYHMHTGAPQRPRFSNAGTSLCWQDGASIWGIADVANPQSPVVRLSRPADSCSSPVPIWMPERGELWVAYVQAVGGDAGDIVLAEWSSCVAQQPTGYVVARSGGSGYDHDCKEAA